MTILYILAAAAVIASIWYGNYRYQKKMQYQNDLLRLLMSGNYPLFLKEIDSNEAKANIPPFNREFLKLNAALLEQDSAAAEEQFKTLLKWELSDPQKIDLYMRGLQYYAANDNRAEAERFRKKLFKLTDNEQIRAEADRFISIYLDKSDRYLGELLAENRVVSEFKKYANDFLIAKIYENRNEPELAEQYRNHQ